MNNFFSKHWKTLLTLLAGAFVVWFILAASFPQKFGGYPVSPSLSTFPTGTTSTISSPFTQSPTVIGEQVYNATAPTLINGQMAPMQSDSLGNSQSNLYTKIAGEDLTNDVIKTEAQYNGYTTTTAGTANAVKSGTGFIHSVTLNRVNTGEVVALYDALTVTGTPFATITIDTTSTAATLTYDRLLTTGLTVVTTAGSGFAPNVSISYR